MPPMGLPDQRVVHGAAALSQYDAVRLFIERALMARPDFQVTNENAPAVAEITARLDGLPLAIELAAARLRLLSPQAILARLGDRLALLSGGSRDLPERQQTLRAAIAWSYDLLEPAERDLFERLGVFMGGWTLEAAEAVAGGSHADRHRRPRRTRLAQRQEPDPGRPGRARRSALHDARDDPRVRHRTTCGRPDAEPRAARTCRLVRVVRRRSRPRRSGGANGAPRSSASRTTTTTSGPALDFLMRTDLPAAARLASSLWRFWQMRGYLDEGRRRLEAIIARRRPRPPPGSGRPAARADGRGRHRLLAGRNMGAHGYYREAVDLARAARHESRSWPTRSTTSRSAPVASTDVAAWTDVPRPGIAQGHRPRPSQIYRELGDEAGMARALWASADFRFYGGDVAGAEREVQEALPIFRRLGDRFGTAWSLHELVLFETVTGRAGRPRRTPVRRSRCSAPTATSRA